MRKILARERPLLEWLLRSVQQFIELSTADVNR